MLDIINTFYICVNGLKNLMEPFPSALHATCLGCLTEQSSYQCLTQADMWPLSIAELCIERPNFQIQNSNGSGWEQCPDRDVDELSWGSPCVSAAYPMFSCTC